MRRKQSPTQHSSAENISSGFSGGTLDRRSLLQGGARLAGGLALAVPFQALLARAANGNPRANSAGYGELVPAIDETTGLALLKLPRGFRYLSYGWTGDVMSDGTHTPDAHDGMAVTLWLGDRVVLTRNHELRGDQGASSEPQITYDPQAPGGTSNLVFDLGLGQFEKSWISLGGTVRNCAGGPTPWGSWLTCEETVDAPGDMDTTLPNPRPLALAKTHGWIFEVPALGRAAPVPIEDMGRFVHEAIAVDPQTGIVYETEDATTAGFYRYTPSHDRLLHMGGKLQMLRVPERDSLAQGVEVGDVFRVEWVDIADPTLAHSSGTNDGLGVFTQGKQQGGTTFARLEGCTCNSGLVYFVSTSGGQAGAGQIWEYSPHRNQLRLIFESPERQVLDGPDNIAISPRGGIVVCEDGELAGQRMHGLTLAGELFPLAQNDMVLAGERNAISGDFRNGEWAGSTFSPDGQWLFANIQTPGVTFAITGPWRDGPL